jgi:nitrate reductase gamma subunit
MPYDFGPFGSAGQSSHYEPDNDAPHKNSIFSLIVMIVVVAVVAAIVLGLAFMALGVLFHLAGWILKVAILAAVAALVWRRITRRRSHDQV